MRKIITSLSPQTRTRIFLLAAMVFLGLSLAMSSSMEPATADGEFDIVDLEFAGTPERAAEILDAWEEEGRAGAARAIWLDYLYLITYSVLLALASGGIALAARGQGRPRLATWGWRMATLSPIAGLLDAIENTALLIVLNGFDRGEINGAATFVADIAARFKFVIVGVAVLFILMAGALLAISRIARPPQ